jgi:uncharacterized protein (DUF1015 family)
MTLGEIRPFRGTFYNPDKISDRSQVTAPPYDVIDAEKKKILSDRSPYNIVRLILPASDNEPAFWNTSERLFEDWKKGRVLVSDEAFCLYAYRQTFSIGGERLSRLGFLAALKCKDFVSGEVLPHEKTFPRTRVERFNLLRACHANFSQVFMICRDEGGKVADILSRAADGHAFLSYEDDEGTRHELWKVEGPGEIADMESLFRQKRLIIADGHHRYETALAFSKETRDKPKTTAASDYVCTAIFRSEDPGLVVLPVHRILKRLPLSLEEATGRLESYFLIEEIADDLEGAARSLVEMRGTAFIMVTARSAFKLILRKGVDLASIIKGEQSAGWKNLDMSVLHSLLLGHCLGVDADRLAEEGGLYFTPWEDAAISDVRRGNAEACFLVRPTAIEEIWRIAEGGERMPHKSSYFYPKIPSGLVIYDHGSAF